MLKFLEAAGNQLLSFSPDTLAQLKPFYGKVFRLQIIEPNYSIDIRPCPDGFVVERADDEKPDVILKGSLWAFIQLGKQGVSSGVFSQGRIHIQGDTQLGDDFQRVLQGLDIDWEEITSKFVGDMTARNIHRAFDVTRSWVRQNNQQAAQNTGEVLQEEYRLVPTPTEVNALRDEIENLRSDTARLEARFAKYLAARNGHST